MDLSKRKILVTGADGFIGSHLVEALVERGCDVRAMVYYNSFNSWGWLDYRSESVKINMESIAGEVMEPNGVTKIVTPLPVKCTERHSTYLLMNRIHYKGNPLIRRQKLGLTTWRCRFIRLLIRR